jgi:hypothetical protein
MANALSEADVDEAHRQLLTEMALVAHDLSEFTFGFAVAVFRRVLRRGIDDDARGEGEGCIRHRRSEIPFLVQACRTRNQDPPEAEAVANNPVALIIPCHRVLAAGGEVGGFSAPSGSATKIRMLALEGVHVAPPPPAQQSFGF